jgi:hypothetical protein
VGLFKTNTVSSVYMNSELIFRRKNIVPFDINTTMYAKILIDLFTSGYLQYKNYSRINN